MCLTWGRRRLSITLSKVFMIIEVRATGRKSFLHLGRGDLGTGTILAVFQFWGNDLCVNGQLEKMGKYWGLTVYDKI